VGKAKHNQRETRVLLSNHVLRSIRSVHAYCLSRVSMETALPSIMSVLPREMVDQSIGYLHADAKSLRACTLVHSSWTPVAQTHLFNTVEIVNTNAMIRLVEVLEYSTHIIPWIKCVALQAKCSSSDVTQYLCIAMIQNSELFARLSTLLLQLRSLELRRFVLDDIGYAFGRTHFLGVTHLKFTDTLHGGTAAAFEQDFFVPRPNLASVSFMDAIVQDSPMHTLWLSKYRKMEISVIYLEGALRLLHALADESHGPSQVECFSVLLPHTLTLPSICKALRATGLLLRTFRIELCCNFHDHGTSLIYL
jgi:hypothetical protein